MINPANTFVPPAPPSPDGQPQAIKEKIESIQQKIETVDARKEAAKTQAQEQAKMEARMQAAEEAKTAAKQEKIAELRDQNQDSEPTEPTLSLRAQTMSFIANLSEDERAELKAFREAAIASGTDDTINVDELAANASDVVVAFAELRGVSVEDMIGNMADVAAQRAGGAPVTDPVSDAVDDVVADETPADDAVADDDSTTSDTDAVDSYNDVANLDSEV